MHEIQDSGEEYVTVPPDLLDSRTGEAGGQVTGGGAGCRAEPRGSALAASISGLPASVVGQSLSVSG